MFLVSSHVPSYSLGWSELPRDILVHIFTRLGNLQDQGRFSRVCHSWRDFASSVALPPCLLLPQKTESTTRSFLPYPYSRTVNYELPDMQDKRLYPTSRGSWFLVLSLDTAVMLFNPITHRKISLPSLSTIDAVQFDASQTGKEYSFSWTDGCYRHNRTYSLQSMRDTFIMKAVMSSSSKDLCFEMVMIVVHGCRRYAYFCKAGGERWLTLSLCIAEIYDLAYSTGYFYILDYGERIQVASCSQLNDASDVTKPSLPLLGLPKYQKPDHRNFDFYLVGSRRGLFFIRAGNSEKGACFFDVFSLETRQQQGPLWKKVNCVSDLAFFICRWREGLSFSTTDGVHQFKGNRIYCPLFFRTDNDSLYWYNPMQKKSKNVSLRCDIEVSDISSSCTWRCPTGWIVESEDLPWFDPWFNPSFD